LSSGIIEVVTQPKKVLIKKYENRRLYDTTNSRYVNLDEVAAMLQKGDHVQVVDSATGEDITRLILTQIIVEDAKTPGSTFPLDVLRQMVIASGRASQDSALRYMKAMLDIYQNTYQVMTPPLNPFEFVQRRDAAPGGVEEPAAASQTGKSPAPPASASEPGEGDELKRRVQELEALVASLASKKTTRTKKTAKTKRR
jgi:polyhydroxyalkanoate synthesis repressor PhaR